MVSSHQIAEQPKSRINRAMMYRRDVGHFTQHFTAHSWWSVIASHVVIASNGYAKLTIHTKFRYHQIPIHIKNGIMQHWTSFWWWIRFLNLMQPWLARSADFIIPLKKNMPCFNGWAVTVLLENLTIHFRHVTPNTTCLLLWKRWKKEIFEFQFLMITVPPVNGV